MIRFRGGGGGGRREREARVGGILSLWGMCYLSDAKFMSNAFDGTLVNMQRGWARLSNTIWRHYRQFFFSKCVSRKHFLAHDPKDVWVFGMACSKHRQNSKQSSLPRPPEILFCCRDILHQARVAPPAWPFFFPSFCFFFFWSLNKSKILN
jgi:hypothetical protein